MLLRLRLRAGYGSYLDLHSWRAREWLPALDAAGLPRRAAFRPGLGQPGALGSSSNRTQKPCVSRAFLSWAVLGSNPYHRTSHRPALMCRDTQKRPVSGPFLCKWRGSLRVLAPGCRRLMHAGWVQSGSRGRPSAVAPLPYHATGARLRGGVCRRSVGRRRPARTRPAPHPRRHVRNSSEIRQQLLAREA